MKEIIYTIIGLLVGIYLFVWAVILVESTACEQKSISFEGHVYGLLSKCMVKHNGKWLPLDNIRGFDDKG